jgi:hypothetical protein
MIRHQRHLPIPRVVLSGYHLLIPLTGRNVAIQAFRGNLSIQRVRR